MLSASSYRRTTALAALFVISAAVLCVTQQYTHAQEAPVNTTAVDDDIDVNQSATGNFTTSLPPQGEFSLLTLIVKGGFLMVPIFLMSILVITLIIERSLNLREKKVLPKDLVTELGRLGSSKIGFDPKHAYRICQSYPSAASTVIRAMLLKVGRPQSEVERAVSEAADREASRLYGGVRWLNLAAAVAPLMGLFGTVWGMIRAFFDTTQLQAGQNKADFLAEGIYVALVTTLGGLAVAIPAAIFSHYFEGRIQNLFYRIEELLFNLMPQIERFEGRLRMNRQTFGEGMDSIEPAPKQPPPVAPVRSK